jgi:hypothetical protein
MPKATGSPDLNSILKKEIKLTFPKIHPLMKKFIAGYLTIFTLLVGTLVGINLMGDSQDIRRGAISNGVVLDLVPSATSVNVDQTFTVNVQLTNRRTYSVSAADIRLTYPTNLLQLVSISKGNYFATSNMQRPAPTNTRGWDNVGMQLYSDPANARYALGALCDYCYLGSSSSTYPEIPACGTITPTCYPKTTTGTLATYTFRAIASGTAIINFNRTSDGAGDIHTKVAVTTLDTNALDDSVGTTTTARSITIASTPPTPTPTGTQSPACAADIVNNQGQLTPDGYVNLADFSFVANNYNIISPCSGTACAADIVNNQGQLTPDGYVNLADFSFVANNYNILAPCNQ